MDAWCPILRPWIRSAEVLGERRYENGNTTTTTNLSTSLDTYGLTSPVGHTTPISDLIGCRCVEEFTCKIIDSSWGLEILIFINTNNLLGLSLSISPI